MYYSMLERGNMFRVYIFYMWELVLYVLKLYYIVCVCYIYINVIFVFVFGYVKYFVY